MCSDVGKIVFLPFTIMCREELPTLILPVLTNLSPGEEIMKDASFHPIWPVLSIRVSVKPPFQVSRRQGWCLSAHHQVPPLDSLLATDKGSAKKTSIRGRIKYIKQDSLTAKILTFPIQFVHKVDRCYICNDAYVKKKYTLYIWYVGIMYVSTVHVAVFWN